jgi:O-acetyl-ADP-ribose deacetylase (regulator of RNase III)
MLLKDKETSFPMQKLILVDRSREFCSVLETVFQNCSNTSIVCGKFEELPEFDCVITAGNSFGLMDAGMDLAVVKYFGTPLMEAIQQQILDDYLGEQPVGTSLLVPTQHPQHPFVAHTPTMRVPMNISGTDNVYQAMWAALTTIHRHNRSNPKGITTVACPGFGTGTGGMQFQEAAYQMKLAYNHMLNPPQRITPSFAHARHEKVHFGGKWGFDNPRPK